MLVLRIALAASVVLALFNTPYFAEQSFGARASHSGFASLFSVAEAAGFTHNGLLPEWSQVYRLFDSWSATSAYFLAVCALSIPIAAVLAALVLVLAPRISFVGDGSAASGSAFILAASGVFCAPFRDLAFRYAFAGPDFASGLRWATLFGSLGALAAAVVLIAIWLFSPWLRQWLVGPARTGEKLAVALVSLAAVSIWAASAEPREAPAGRPNILLVSIDTLRADHVHSYGYHRETTPALDRLASEGVRFETVTSSSSWTLPAHMSLLTGLDSLHHGVVSDFSNPLARDVPTLAEVLHQAGYATAAVVSAPYLSARWGYSRGFDQYNDYSVDSRSSQTWPVVLQQVQRILDAWSAAEPTRPLFLFVHLWDAHSDFEPPPPYDALFDPDYNGDLDAANFLGNDTIVPDMPARDLEHLIALYDGEIRYTDDGVAALLDRFRKLGALDETIVSVTSDHGEEFFEHGRKGHRSTLYDESIQVPWILSYPGRLPAGRTVSTPVRLIDVAPTLLSLAGVPASDFGRGPASPFVSQDVGSLAWGETTVSAATPAFSHLDTPSCCIPGPLFSIRTAGAKFIYDPDGKVPSRLYDLDEDSGEASNLVGRGDSREQALSVSVRAWRERFSDQRRDQPVPLDLEEIEALKDLGYIQ